MVNGHSDATSKSFHLAASGCKHRHMVGRVEGETETEQSGRNIERRMKEENHTRGTKKERLKWRYYTDGY